MALKQIVDGNKTILDANLINPLLRKHINSLNEQITTDDIRNTIIVEKSDVSAAQAGLDSQKATSRPLSHKGGDAPEQLLGSTDDLYECTGVSVAGNSLKTVELHSCGPGSPGDIAVTDGLNTIGDGGGGRWYWNSTADKRNANVGTSIDPDTALTHTAQGTGTGTGCWVRMINDGTINPRWWGAVDSISKDSTTAFKAMIAYLTSIRLGSGAGPNQYSLEGLRISIPDGVYKITEPIIFDTFRYFTVESGGAEIWYNGTALTDDVGALEFKSCSFFTVRGLYIYASFEIDSCYWVKLSSCKMQGAVIIYGTNDLLVDAVWWWYGTLTIIKGHMHTYTGCNFEKVSEAVSMYNPDTVVFQGCYTEWSDTLFQVIADDTYDDPRSVIWRNCFLDVQKQGSVNDDPAKSALMFKDKRTTKVPLEATYLIDGCNWTSVAAAPGLAQVGSYVHADDTFKDIRVLNSTASISGAMVKLGYFGSVANGESDQLFSGLGIYCDDAAKDHDNPLKNGNFSAAILQKTAMDSTDPYREDNKGWWATDFAGTADGTLNKNGNHLVVLTSGSKAWIHIPVNSAYSDPDNYIQDGYKYFFRLTKRNDELVVQINAVTATGASKVIGSDLRLAGYTTNIPANPYEYNTYEIAFEVPAGLGITYVQIKLGTLDANKQVNLYDASIRKAGSNPAGWFPRRDNHS